MCRNSIRSLATLALGFSGLVLVTAPGIAADGQMRQKTMQFVPMMNTMKPVQPMMNVAKPTLNNSAVSSTATISPRAQSFVAGPASNATSSNAVASPKVDTSTARPSASSASNVTATPQNTSTSSANTGSAGSSTGSVSSSNATGAVNLNPQTRTWSYSNSPSAYCGWKEGKRFGQTECGVE